MKLRTRIVTHPLVSRGLRRSRLFSFYEAAALLSRGYGWDATFRSGVPADGGGAPVPWMTYPAITFLSERVRAGMTVFEYGTGQSTLWWASRVAHIVSCEHDPDWHARVIANLPANAEVILVPLGQGAAYSEAVLRSGDRYDVIVIDGRDRIACARNAVEALTPGGVIVWDNSDREEYQEGFHFLQDAGFRRIDFHGPGPVNAYLWKTAVFYRTSNCLGL